MNSLRIFESKYIEYRISDTLKEKNNKFITNENMTKGIQDKEQNPLPINKIENFNNNKLYPKKKISVIKYIEHMKNVNK